MSDGGHGDGAAGHGVPGRQEVRGQQADAGDQGEHEGERADSQTRSQGGCLPDRLVPRSDSERGIFTRIFSIE